MAISRLDLGNLWPRSQARSVAKVTYEINSSIYSHCFCFVQIRRWIIKTQAIYHLTLKCWGQGRCKIQEKNISEFSGHIDSNCGTNSKYGINACIDICFFSFRLHFNVQFTMKYSGDQWAYFAMKNYLFITNVWKVTHKVILCWINDISY